MRPCYALVCVRSYTAWHINAVKCVTQGRSITCLEIVSLSITLPPRTSLLSRTYNSTQRQHGPKSKPSIFVNWWLRQNDLFLPRDATQSAVLPQYVCLSVCSSFLSARPSVTFRYRDHIGWNTSKIILRLIRLRFVTPTWTIWCTGTTPRLGWNRGGFRSAKTCNISETVQDRTKVTMTD